MSGLKSAMMNDGLTVLVAEKEQTRPGSRYGPIIRNLYIIECCTKGYGAVVINGKEFPVKPGDCYVLLPGDTVTHFADTTDPRAGYWCALNSPTLKEFLNSVGITSASPFANPSVFQEALNWIQQLVLIWPRTDPGSQMQQIGCAYGLLGAIARSKQSMENSTVIDRAIGLIETNYPSPLTVADIAQAAGFEESYFSVLFKKKTGMSPYKYLTQLRIHKACKLMLTQSYSLAQIAQLIGLDEHNFSRIFKREQGMTPTEYLNKYKKS